MTLPCLCSPGASGSTTTEDHRQLLERNPKAELKFEEDTWRHPAVHGALHAMQGWVCAYCQKELDPLDKRYVDHFRPKKGGYWWLAYAFENYFLTCGSCNEFKGDRFPLVEGTPRVCYETRADIVNEQRLLIDAVADPVDAWLRIEVEDEAAMGDVVSRLDDAVTIAWKRVDETIRKFRWNLDLDIRQPRLRYIEELTTLLNTGEYEKLRRSASRFAKYSLTARSFLEMFKPDLLPDERTDLQWFVEWLCERLNQMAEQRKKEGSESSSLARRRRVVQWTLAVLWKDPPTGTPQDIEAWLDAAGCKKQVEWSYKQLTEGDSTQSSTPDDVDTD